MPLQVIENGLCGPGLLAHVILSKHVDHRPLYRVQQELARHGVEITRTTLADWVATGAGVLEPLVVLIRKDLILGDHLLVDEMPVRAMDPEFPGKTTQG